MTEDLSWFSVSEASAHDQLALYFVGCGENMIGKNEEETY